MIELRTPEQIIFFILLFLGTFVVTGIISGVMTLRENRREKKMTDEADMSHTT